MYRGPLVVALVGALAACSAEQVRRANPLSTEEVSVEREREMTAEIHQIIRTRAPLINDPVLLDWVHEIGGEIVAATEPQPFIYRFFVIEDDELNAFTIGGGYVYLHSAVIAQSGDVNELAGVLAHEIAHVRLRHVTRRAEGSGIATLATLAGLAAVAAGADPGVLILAQGLNQSLQIQHTRRHEAEADRSGLSYLVETGYDPLGMSRFFQRLLAAYPSSGRGVPSYLFTHPAVKERVAGARVELERIEAPRDQSRKDARLARMQERLVVLRTRVAGGSGLHARAEFGRAHSDPLLERAQAAATAGDRTTAGALLAEAARLEPTDPRVALAAADLAAEQADHEAALAHLERAWKLDPHVPLVQYRLGLAHRKLGHRSRAVFFLERAAAGFQPGSKLRHSAELEIARVEFPVLEDSMLAPDDGIEGGQVVSWSGKLGSRYKGRAGLLRIEWVAPDGRVVERARVRVERSGALSARLQTTPDAPAGRWSVRVLLGDTLVDERSFELRRG